MSKKEHQNIITQNLDQIMSDRFGRYSKYIIQERALPDARDGLKPVQRRILYAMYQLGLGADKSFKKSARVVGEVIGKYHPHGDTSIYDALIRMSQEWKINFPLIEVHGNKGSIDDDPAAAMRYTEARLSQIAMTMLDNLDKQTVKFNPNFDDSETEPTILPALIPNLLINGALGIAAGYATDMPPHNLGEVIDSIIAKIENPAINLKQLNKIIKGPDFPTGAIIQGKEGIKEAFERGAGKILIRAKVTFSDPLAKHPFIRVTQIPYGVNKARLVRQIDEIRYHQEIAGILEVRDETDRKGIAIMIELTKGSPIDKIANYLFNKTDLQIYYHYNNIAIVNNRPTKLGLVALIDSYLDHQKKIQMSALKFDLNKYQTRYQIVEGLIKANKIIDQIIDLIKNTKGSRQAVVDNLIAKFHFSLIQADAISQLRLYRLSQTDQFSLTDEAKQLKTLIDKTSLLINSKSKFNHYLVEQLKVVKDKFNVSRKSVIENKISETKVDLEELLEHQDYYLGVSIQGYLKRLPNKEYTSQEISTYVLKEGDNLNYFYKINTSHKILLFTNKGHYIFLPAHKLEETKWNQVGRHLNDFTLIKANEKIVDVIVVENFNFSAFITLVTKHGKGKRVRLGDFYTTRYKNALKAINLEEHDKLVSAKLTSGHHQLVILSSFAKAVRYAEIQLATYSLRSSGIKAISLPKDAHVVKMEVVFSDDVLGLISSRGGLKRIRVKQIEPMSRTTQGKSLYHLLKTQAHHVLDLKVAFPKTLISTIQNNQLVIWNFQKTEITTSHEGFSFNQKVHLDQATILNFVNFKDQDFSKKNQSENQIETTFTDAEKDIDSASQLSIDDILDSLK